MKRELLVLLMAACSNPPERPFVMPRNIEDARGRLIAAIPEGRDIAGARQWMHDHGFTCSPPAPWTGADGKSPADTAATPGFAHACHPDATASPDAGWHKWTVVLIERKGRLADLQVH
jgi:hypothetical protein